MKEQAVWFLKNGYNCSQCILKAAEKVFGISCSKACIDMCSAVNTGFGIGGICSVLVAGIMVFGVMFDAPTAKRLRIRLLSEHGKACPTDCGKLRNLGSKSGCEEVVGNAAGLIEEIIRSELAG